MIQNKLENLKLQMKRLNVEILDITEIRWKKENDFQLGEYKTINIASKKGLGEV